MFIMQYFSLPNQKYHDYEKKKRKKSQIVFALPFTTPLTNEQ